MAIGSDAERLMVERAAAQAQIPVEVLQALLGLEGQFIDFNLQGAKVAFTNKVAEILEQAAGREGEPV